MLYAMTAGIVAVQKAGYRFSGQGSHNIYILRNQVEVRLRLLAKRLQDLTRAALVLGIQIS